MPNVYTPEKPKILIGVPGFAGIVPEAQEHFARMIFRCGRDLPQYDFALEVITKREQFRARNQLVDAAIGAGCEYLLMLDDDMIVPPDLVSRLLAHEKDVVGALYYQRGGAFHPVVMHLDTAGLQAVAARFYLPSDPILTQPGLYPVDVIGGGCMLFKVDVFRKLMPPYFWWEEQLGTDIAICYRLKEAGVQAYIDTSLELGHVGERHIVTSQSISRGSQYFGEIREALWKDMGEYLGMPSGELESRMAQASRQEVRQDTWNETDRSTWEGVRSFYQTHKDWHLLNLLYWAMAKQDAMCEWLLNNGETRFRPGELVVDVGPGIGLVAHTLALQGSDVLAVDIAGAPTLDFLCWRMRQENLPPERFRAMELYEPSPVGLLPDQASCMILTSMLDHCWAPYETLTWAIDNLRPGGFLVCDYMHSHVHREDEPQHLVRYDAATLPQWFTERGMDQSPEFYWLWKKRLQGG